MATARTTTLTRFDPIERGYYAETFDRRGKLLHTTPCFPAPSTALATAKKWLAARQKAKVGRYKYADACRLQGLPENFLEHCPFTADGKLKAVANGVPLMMGRAIARAVKFALAAK